MAYTLSNFSGKLFQTPEDTLKIDQGMVMRASGEHTRVCIDRDLESTYLLQMYIVTSKPKRISVAVGLVHMSILL